MPLLANAQQSGEDLTKKLANPIASLISVPFQGNWDYDIGPQEDGERFTLNIQPVIPISISEGWNLISRTIIPLVNQRRIFPGSGGFHSAGLLSENVGWGFSFAGNFGGVLDYDNEWAGRRFAQTTNLIGLNLVPSLSWRLTPELSLGLALNVMGGFYEFKSAPRAGLLGAMRGSSTRTGTSASAAILVSSAGRQTPPHWGWCTPPKSNWDSATA